MPSPDPTRVGRLLSRLVEGSVLVRAARDRLGGGNWTRIHGGLGSALSGSRLLDAVRRLREGRVGRSGDAAVWQFRRRVGRGARSSRVRRLSRTADGTVIVDLRNARAARAARRTRVWFAPTRRLAESSWLIATGVRAGQLVRREPVLTGSIVITVAAAILVARAEGPVVAVPTLAAAIVMVLMGGARATR